MTLTVKSEDNAKNYMTMSLKVVVSLLVLSLFGANEGRTQSKLKIMVDELKVEVAQLKDSAGKFDL